MTKVLLSILVPGSQHTFTSRPCERDPLPRVAMGRSQGTLPSEASGPRLLMILTGHKTVGWIDSLTFVSRRVCVSGL